MIINISSLCIGSIIQKCRHQCISNTRNCITCKQCNY